MNAEIIYEGYYGIAKKVVRCLCPDGLRRTVVLTKEACTFFSIPARAKAKGKTVAGFVTGCETDGMQDFRFIPYQYSKNHAVFQET